MDNLEIKKDGENYRVSLFYGSNRRRQEAYYWNTITKDKRRLAQILFDLAMQGFPVLEACSLVKQKLDNKDWSGF